MGRVRAHSQDLARAQPRGRPRRVHRSRRHHLRRRRSRHRLGRRSRPGSSRQGGVRRWRYARRMLDQRARFIRRAATGGGVSDGALRNVLPHQRGRFREKVRRRGYRLAPGGVERTPNVVEPVATVFAEVAAPGKRVEGDVGAKYAGVSSAPAAAKPAAAAAAGGAARGRGLAGSGRAIHEVGPAVTPPAPGSPAAAVEADRVRYEVALKVLETSDDAELKAKAREQLLAFLGWTRPQWGEESVVTVCPVCEYSIRRYQQYVLTTSCVRVSLPRRNFASIPPRR